MDDVTAGQGADSAALASMYELHHERLRRYLVARLGRYDFHLAQDLASETWIRAVRDVRKCRSTAAEAFGWLRSIANRVVIEHYLCARKQREQATDFTGVRAYSLPPAPAAEDEALAKVAVLARLREHKALMAVAA